MKIREIRIILCYNYPVKSGLIVFILSYIFNRIF